MIIRFYNVPLNRTICSLIFIKYLRKVDPDELSPNMRLGLPDESRYDLDRLMYSPENMKNGFIKRAPRKDMIGLEGLEVCFHHLDKSLGAEVKTVLYLLLPQYKIGNK